mgnify:CR=1 FL=1
MACVLKITRAHVTDDQQLNHFADDSFHSDSVITVSYHGSQNGLYFVLEHESDEN